MVLSNKNSSDNCLRRRGIQFLWVLVCTGVFLLLGCGKKSNKIAEFANKIDQLAGLPIDESKVTRQFYMEYNANPDPGRRIWKGVEDIIWYEVYPGGTNSLFLTVEKTSVKGAQGVIAKKIEKGKGKEAVSKLKEGAFQVFIPNADTSSRLKRLYYRYYKRNRWGNWNSLSQIHDMTLGPN